MFWSTTVGAGGLLFGFDTAVISAADQPLQGLWQTSALLHGALVMSSALWGTVIGALTGHLPSDRLGRRPTLVLLASLYLFSAMGSALAVGPVMFGIMRFVGGLGVGLSSIVVPAYISEIAPPADRGCLGALYQFQIVLGILLAYVSNFALSELAGLDWRWMLGAEALPALIFLGLVVRVPESPRWLLLYAADEPGCRRVLQMTDPDVVEKTVAEIRRTREGPSRARLFTRPHLAPVLLAFAVAAFNQLSGINFVIYFAPRIFGLAGLDSRAALLSTTGIGLTNLVMTVVGMLAIDRVGRRPLLLVGSVGYVFSLLGVAWAFLTGAGGMVVASLLFLFIASHAVGQGIVIWVFIAEVFPNAVRTKGQSLGCGTHWVGAALITLLMPVVLGRYEAHTIFMVLAAVMVLQLVFVLTLIPETRGQSLESLAERWQNTPGTEGTTP